jgi:hypothetical protein
MNGIVLSKFLFIQIKTRCIQTVSVNAGGFRGLAVTKPASGGGKEKKQ